MSIGSGQMKTSITIELIDQISVKINAVRLAFVRLETAVKNVERAFFNITAVSGACLRSFVSVQTSLSSMTGHINAANHALIVNAASFRASQGAADTLLHSINRLNAQNSLGSMTGRINTANHALTMNAAGFRASQGAADALLHSINRLNSAQINPPVPPVPPVPPTPNLGSAAPSFRGININDAGSKMKGIGTFMLGAAGGMLGASGAVVHEAMSQEDAFVLLRNTLNSGDTETQMDALTAKARELGLKYPGSAKAMAEMFTALRQQGKSVSDILNGVGEATAQFATLAGFDFRTAAVYSAKFAEAFGLEAQDTSALVDTLVKLQGASGVTADQLFQTMKYMGPAVRSLKITEIKDKKAQKEAVDNLSAMVGVLSKSGIEDSMAGTGISMAFGRMAKVQELINSSRFAYKSLLDAHGIDLQFFKSGRFVGIEGAVRELEKLNRIKDDDIRLNILNKLFGQEAGRSMQILAASGVSGLKQVRREMDSQLSAAERTSNIMSSSSQKLGIIMEGIQTLTAALGDKISKHFKIPDLLDLAASKLQKIIAWINDEKNKTAINDYLDKAKSIFFYLVKIGSALTAAGTALTSAASAAASFSVLKTVFNLPSLFAMPMLRSWFRRMSAGILLAFRSAGLRNLIRPLSSFSGIARIASVLASINTASIAIAAAALLIYKYWEPLKNFFSGFWDGMKEGWQQAAPQFEYLKQTVCSLIEDIKLFWNTAGDASDTAFGASLGIAVMQTLGDLARYTAYTIDAVKLSLAEIGSNIGTSFAYIFDGGFLADLTAVNLIIQQFLNDIKTWFNNALNRIADRISKKYDDIVRILKDGCSTVKNVFISLLAFMQDIGSGIVSSLIKGIESGWNRIKSVSDRIKNMFPFSVSPSPSASQQNFDQASAYAAEKKKASAAHKSSPRTSSVVNNDNKTVSFNFYGVGENSVQQLTAAADRLNFGMA